MNNLNNFVEALVSISEVQNLVNASGEDIKLYVERTTENLDEQLLKFINPYILNYQNTFVIRNLHEFSYYNNRGGLSLTNFLQEYKDKITLTIMDNPNHFDALTKTNDFTIIENLSELKTLGERHKAVILNYNGIHIYVKHRSVIFGVDSSHQKDYLKTILESLRSVLVILAFNYPNIVTREIVESISRDLPELKEIERSLKLGIIQNSVKGFDVEDDIKLFRRLEKEAREDRQTIKYLTNDLAHTQALLDSKNEDLKHIQERLEELGPKIFNKNNSNAEDLHNLILDVSTHFLIKDLHKINQIGNVLEITLVTKPIKVSKFDMDPYKLINRRVTDRDMSDEVGEAYKNAFQNKDNSNEHSWEVYFSPVLISFNIYKNEKQSSGISINNLYIEPIYSSYYNPHSNANCYGTYRKLIDDSMETGSVTRLLNILSEYLGSVTLGDIGGGYTYSSKLARKGEKIKWETSNQNIVNQWLKDQENQKQENPETSL